MVAILEKTEHNIDFYQIVDFLEASHKRYALTISPTVYVSYIRQFWSIARIETTNQETKILATVDGKTRTISESSLRRHLKLNDEEGISSLPDAELFENLSLMGYNILPNQRFTFQKGQFSHQWKFLIHTIMVYNFSKMIFDGMVRNINSKAPTETLTPRRYTRRAIRIAQSKALSPAADEPASLLRDDRQGEAFPTISSLDAGMQQRIHELIELCTSLQRQQSQMVAKIKDQDLEISELKERVKEELGADKSTKLGSNDTEEMVNVLSSKETANILTSGGAAASVSPGDVLPTVGVPIVSGSFPTVSAIFTTATREMEEEFSRENQRVSEQLARDSEIARLHAEKELKMMIEGLDRNNEVIAKHLREYEQAAVDLSVGEKLELISELVKYQAQQSKPLSKKEQREFYMSLEDFVPMYSKEESERVKRQGLKVDQWSSKRMKTSEGVSEEELKGMMQLVPLEEQLDREDLHQLWTLVKETFSIKQATKDKEKELWVEPKRLFEPDFKDHLWTHNQVFMHDSLDWKLYDTCGVHHVSTKDQEIFMLVEKDYPLRKGLVTMMIILDEELIEASSPGEHLILET
nr:hypothetical protein [Tanacetum cinerariifolium]